MSNAVRLATLLGIAAGSLALAADPPQKTASIEGITEYRFENGLRAVLFPDPSQSKVTVNMTVLVGSRQEGYGETGMAHLLEHMVFKGTPRHPLIPKALQDHGAVFNGSTSSDRVNYFETLPATDENLEFALDLEADRLVNSFIKREDLESEMTVVRNEFERGENSAPSVLGKRMAAAAYNWHNYGKPTIGNRSDIERVPVENLRAFYQKYYQPDNIVVIVAGRFEEQKGLALVQKYFGTLPRPKRVLNATYTEEPAQDGERSVVLRRVGDLGAVGVAYHIPAGPHEDVAALQVLANILSTRPSGRLYRLLVETKKAAGVSASAGGEHDPGLMSVDAEVSKEGSIEEVRDAIVNAVEDIGQSGVSDQEVNRAKQQMLKAREMAANDTARIGVSLSEWAAQGDWRLYFLHRDQIEKVTPEAVKTAAARYLQRNNRTVGLFLPTDKAARVEIPPTPELEPLLAGYKGRAVVAQGEAFDASPANVEARVRRIELDGGFKVSLLPKKSRGEEAHLTLTLHYGSEETLKGMESAAAFLPEMMMRGTKKLSQQQLRDELDRLKANLGTGAGGGGGRGGRRGGGGGGGGGAAGTLSFSIQAKHDTLPEVIGLLGQVLREPLLPEDQFGVLKSERLSRIEQMRSEPSVLGPRLLEQVLNPWKADNIRYIPTIDESVERLRAATYEQVVTLYREFLGAEYGEAAIVGDFDAEACLKPLSEALKGWHAAKPYARIPMPLAGEVPGGRREVNTPDKDNATYSAGLVFPLRDDDPDYPALVMGNHILGAGALASRLGNRIRQKEGLSYGVSSSLAVSSWDQRAVLSITAISNPKNEPKVVKAAQEELERLVRDGVTAEELDSAKEGYLAARRVARSTDVALATALNTLRHRDRTMAFEAEFEKRLEALTPEAVNAALKKHLDPRRLVVVTAGDFPTSSPPPAVARPE